MKTILWNLQLSAIEKNTSKFLLSKDSNFSVCINTIKALNEYFVGKYDHIVLIPKNRDKIEVIKNVKYIESSNYITNVFSSRYQWDVENFTSILTNNKIDLIWENNPTLVNNWKTLLLELDLIDQIKVITYNHWIDSDKYPKIDKRSPYYFRQCEGLMLSDLFLCNSQEAKNQITEVLWDLFDAYSINFDFYLNSKINTLPPYNVDDFEKLKLNKIKHNAVRIIYNHRLSSMYYYKDALDLFLKVIERIQKSITKSLEIIFTDASGKLNSIEELRYNIENELIVFRLMNNLDKQSYENLLLQTDICIGTFLENSGGCWSISIVDALLHKNAILVPDHSGYKEIVGDSFEYLIDTSDVEDISSKLLKLINDEQERENNYSSAVEYYMNNYSSDKLTTKLYNLISNL